MCDIIIGHAELFEVEYLFKIKERAGNDVICDKSKISHKETRIYVEVA